MEIGKNVYEAFNTFELQDVSHMNVVDRHLEQSEIWDSSLYERVFQKEEGVEEMCIRDRLNGLIPHFYPGEIQGDLLMDGHSLLEMKPSELAGQVGTVFQDPRSQFFMTDTTRELAFGCENLGLSVSYTHLDVYKRQEYRPAVWSAED